MLGTYALGIYPRSPKLIEATRSLNTNLDTLFRSEKAKLIKLQIKYKLTFVADPMLNWNDHFRPFAKMQGIRLGALNRFFETNNFYRKLIIDNELKDYGNIVLNNISLDLLPENSAVVLPDPYTFTLLNENYYYKNYEDYILVVSTLLNKEAEVLSNVGIKFIQLDAPGIAYNANNITDIDIIKKAIERVKNGIKSKIYLHLYFGNISKILDKLLEIKIDGLSIDLAYNKLEEIIEHKFNDKGIGLGVIDTTNTKLEDLKIAKEIEDTLNKIKPKEAYLCTNTDPEFIPYEFLPQKLSRLRAIAKSVRFNA